MEFFSGLNAAIAEVAGLLKVVVAGKEVARLKYRAEAGMNYVFVDEKTGEYKDIDDKKQKSLKVHFRKRIFDAS